MKFANEAELAKFYNQQTKFALEAVASTIKQHHHENIEQEFDDYTAATYIISVYEKKIALLAHLKVRLELLEDEQKIHLLKIIIRSEESRLEHIQERLFEFWGVLKSYDLSEQLLELKQLEEYLQKHPELYTVPELDDITFMATPSPKPIPFEWLSEAQAQGVLDPTEEDALILDFDAWSINREHSSTDIVYDNIPIGNLRSEQEKIAAAARDLEQLVQRLAEEEARLKQYEHDFLSTISVDKTQIAVHEPLPAKSQQLATDQSGKTSQKSKIELRKSKLISHMVQKPIVPLRQRCSREQIAAPALVIKANPEKPHYLTRS